VEWKRLTVQQHYLLFREYLEAGTGMMLGPKLTIFLVVNEIKSSRTMQQLFVKV
jgi:hypothetical protein